MRVRAYNSRLYQNTDKPLKRSPVKRSSPKGRAIDRILAEIKMEKLKAQVDERGYNFCVMPGCGFSVRQEISREYLDLDHIIQVSLGGEHTHANTRLVCRPCHSKRHESGR